MRIVDCVQKTPEWFAARAGYLTSSNADDIFKEGRKKGEESVGKRDLRIRLALEQLIGRSLDDDGYVSREMQRGTDLELAARSAYEAHTGQLVSEAGFIAHDTHMAGASLDGYLGDFDGVTEFKAPKSSTHLGYLRGGRLPSDYTAQVRHQVWLAGAQWADFVSFDPRMPDGLQLFIVRVRREELDIPGYEKAALAFLMEVETERRAIATMANPLAVLAEAAS